jgi:hypothetical protein
MANNQVGDRARFYISSATAQNKRLRKVTEMKETNNRDAEHVFNTGDDAPAGVIRKPGGFELELTVLEEKGTPEVDWYKLEDSGEFFELVREVVGGRRMQYTECCVANAAATDDNQGKHEYTVKVIASERKVL